MFKVKKKAPRKDTKNKRKAQREKIEQVLEEVKQLSVEAESFFDSLEQKYTGEEKDDGH